ncbi:MAG: DMT family transporter [Candidatus Woesearchaeota archaeon]|nr:DMT family transporter [Candidatus Woesearchaeota archaeon]
MSWILFAILASLLWSGSNIIDKYIYTKLLRNPVVSVIIMGLIGLILSIIICIVRGFSELSYTNIFIAFICSAVYTLAVFLYFKAVRIEEISTIVPLFYVTPLFVLILAAIFLGEVFTPLKYLGIFLLVAGAMLISAKGSFRLSFGKAFWLVMASSLAISVNSVVTKYLLGFADFWTVYAYMRIGVFVCIIPFCFMNFEDIKHAVKKHKAKAISWISISELLNLAAIFLSTIAVSIGYVTLVGALTSIQPFFVLAITVLMSIYVPKILKEEIGKSAIALKLAAIMIMFAGAMMVGI